MQEIKNIDTNNKTINMIEEKIKEVCKEMYDEIDELKRLNKTNYDNINKFINDKSNHIVERYIMWNDYSDKEHYPDRIYSDILLHHVYADNRYETIYLLDGINDGILSKIFYYGEYEEDRIKYIKKCVDLFENIKPEGVYATGYNETIIDKSYLSKIMEEMIELNIEIFENDW